MSYTCLHCDEWFEVYHDIDGWVRFCPCCGSALIKEIPGGDFFDKETNKEDEEEDEN